MKKIFIIALLLIGCATTQTQPRDFSLGCQTDMECELEDPDDMSAEDYQRELDDLRYWAETGKVRM